MRVYSDCTHVCHAISHKPGKHKACGRAHTRTHTKPHLIVDLHHRQADRELATGGLPPRLPPSLLRCYRPEQLAHCVWHQTGLVACARGAQSEPKATPYPATIRQQDTRLSNPLPPHTHTHTHHHRRNAVKTQNSDHHPHKRQSAHGSFKPSPTSL